MDANPRPLPLRPRPELRPELPRPELLPPRLPRPPRPLLLFRAIERLEIICARNVRPAPHHTYNGIKRWLRSCDQRTIRVCRLQDRSAPSPLVQAQNFFS